MGLEAMKLTGHRSRVMVFEPSCLQPIDSSLDKRRRGGSTVRERLPLGVAQVHDPLAQHEHLPDMAEQRGAHRRRQRRTNTDPSGLTQAKRDSHADEKQKRDSNADEPCV